MAISFDIETLAYFFIAKFNPQEPLKFELSMKFQWVNFSKFWKLKKNESKNKKYLLMKSGLTVSNPFNNGIYSLQT